MFFVILIVLIFFIALPIWAAQRIGDRNGRHNAWLWGFLLGWLGVLIVAILGPVRDRELEALERAVRKTELERRQAELQAP